MRRIVLFFTAVVYQGVVEAEWSYSGETGPAYWSKVYPVCAEARQSPIEIHHESAETDDDLTSFKFEGYNHTRNHENLTVWNDGYTVTIRVHGDVKIQGGGLSGKYVLRQFHMHWGPADDEGSEHVVDGQSYPLEVHFVHQTMKYHDISDALEDPSGFAVLGVFAKVGKHHPYFQKIIENLHLLDIGDWANVRPFPMEKLLPNDTETFYRYEGSLTTPPCSESVIWTVFRQYIEISEEQMNKLRIVSEMANVTANYRPVQNLNGRRLSVRKKVDLLQTIRTVGVHEESDGFFGDGQDPYNSASRLIFSTTTLVDVLIMSLCFLLS